MDRRSFTVVERKTCEPCHQRNSHCDAKEPTCSSCGLDGSECTWATDITRVRDSPEPNANGTESSRLDGLVEIAKDNSERHLSLEEAVAELNEGVKKENERIRQEKARIRQEKERIRQENDVEMICSDDEPFDFNTVTKIHPMERYHFGTSDMEDADEQDHEPPKWARLARALDVERYWYHPPSISGLPSRYTLSRQDQIIDVYFHAFNQSTPLFSEDDYEFFEEDCRLRGNEGNEWTPDRSGDSPILHDDIDLERAGFMHAIAVKLIYKLGYHKMFGESLKPVWIAYIIDRDLSLLTGEPYLMQDHDLDPSVTDLSEEDGGILYNKGTSLRFEIFKFRSRLAAIQGKIFDFVYSVRAEKLSFDQRETVADRLEEMLEKWVDSIPEPFRGDTVPGFDYVQLRFVKQLHVTYYHCIFSIRRANLRNLEWVERLLCFGEARDPIESDTPLLPSSWPTLVTAARMCLDTVTKVDSRDMAFRWTCTHATQAAMTVLAANNITLSEHNLHDSIDKDQQRLHIAHGEISGRLKEEDPTGSFEHSFNTCGELIIKARESVQRFNENKQVEEL
ncbi:hypothetical protein FCIRC_4935 [Fusarium circinatum]|uniref:Zn(2)-C6 fungal-type domain-containing protein n=1 Tax=Fusarium circinatum TaxID=48490 RepID=A0A8H5X427_FUSCI|nr:hypothetical protein FCIRC_4935 [Fusarium circinatum]